MQQRYLAFSLRSLLLTLSLVGMLGSTVSCSDPTAAVLGPEQAEIDGLRIEATARSTGSRLEVQLRLTNGGNRVRLIQYGGDCNPLLRFYRPQGSTERLVWDQLRWRRATNTPCALYLVNTELAPGDVINMTAILEARAVLGDSLSAGRYDLAVSFASALPEGEVEVRLGSLRLSD
jgi:hypothetical protein